MNRTLLYVFLVALGFVACKKESSLIPPVAEFTVDGDTSHSSTLTIGPYDQYSLYNNSMNADSYIWDLGNGTTSTNKETVLTYRNSGTYTVTLTAINADGSKSVASRKVKVVDPILRQVVIKTLDLSAAWGRPASSPAFSKADVWVEILKAEPDHDYPVLSNGTFDAPVIYKSRIATNIDSSSVPIIFDIPQRIVVDIPTLLLSYGYKGRGYGFNLYARDATGTYLLSSNFWSGVGSLYRGSIPENKFSISTGILGSYMDFNGVYE